HNGTPRCAMERLQQSVVPTVTPFVHGLDPRAEVDVSDGGDWRARHAQSFAQVRGFGHDSSLLRRSLNSSRLCDGSHQEHVRTLLSWLHVEPFRRLFRKHTRREWAKAFPELDSQVHGALHFNVARITEDAAGA